MKLIVQIPCFNEEQTLSQTIADIPRVIPGVEVVEVLVIDDGSTDRTVRVAREAGADHVVKHKTNRGLAQTFRTGIDSCLRLGADIIVNTDGDNQYAGSCIPMLIQPILNGEADMVIGDRQIRDNPGFSWTRKRLQALGSFVVRRLSRTNIPDTVSGFRAISREAALNLNIVSPFSYTIEMLSVRPEIGACFVTGNPVSTTAPCHSRERGSPGGSMDSRFRGSDQLQQAAARIYLEESPEIGVGSRDGPNPSCQEIGRAKRNFRWNAIGRNEGNEPFSHGDRAANGATANRLGTGHVLLGPSAGTCAAGRSVVVIASKLAI